MRSLICTHLAPSVGHAWCKVHSTVAERMHYARMHPGVVRSVASQLTHPTPGINCDQRNQMPYVLQSAFSARGKISAIRYIMHGIRRFSSVNAGSSASLCRASSSPAGRRYHLLAVTRLMTDWNRCCVALQRHRPASFMRAGPHPPALRCT